MKTLIASALILTAGLAQATSFDHERQIGSAELYSTLAADGYVQSATPPDRNFAYQRAIGATELFPTLVSEGVEPPATSGNAVFKYQMAIGSAELDPSLS